jgi:hypothetical protein
MATFSCAEQDCTEDPVDYVRVALTTPTGAMTIECLLCSMHIGSLELGNHGTFLYIRPRNRLDMNGR